MPYVLALGLLPVPVLIAAARTHRYWTVQVIFAAGTVLLLAYPPALAFALATALGLIPARDKSLSAMGIVGLVFLLALAPAAWETGNEAPPTWALSPRRRDRA